MDLLSKIGGLLGTALKTKEDSKDANQAVYDAGDRLESLDWKPTYASDQAPDFQKAQSPAARAYLESFLSGSNPNAVQGTRLGATQDKAAAQERFDSTYGGWDKIAEQQQRANADNARYKVEAPEEDLKYTRGLVR